MHGIKRHLKKSPSCLHRLTLEDGEMLAGRANSGAAAVTKGGSDEGLSYGSGSRNVKNWVDSGDLKRELLMF